MYPAHGAGSLCGKATSTDLDSTIGKELKTNYALQPMCEEEFVKVLLEDQPFIPKYFGYDVALNKPGAQPFAHSVRAVPRLQSATELEPGVLLSTPAQRPSSKQATCRAPSTCRRAASSKPGWAPS